MRKLVKSFRVRLLVWTVAVACVVLLLFGLVAGVALYRLKLSSIDDRLLSLASNRFPPPENDRTWGRLDDGIRRTGERSLGSSVAVFGYEKDNNVFFASETIKGKIVPDDLPNVKGDRDLELEMRFRERPGGPGPSGDRPREGFRRGGIPENIAEVRRGGPPHLQQAEREPLVFVKMALEIEGRPWHFLVFEMAGFSVGIGVEMTEAMEDIHTARDAFLWALPIALGLLALGAWFFSGQAIRPLKNMTTVASKISAKNLSERIHSEKEDDEFRDLAAVLNSMLSRLEAGFAQATRFSADAAHELKTPLAILQGHLESMLQEAEDGSSIQQTLGMLLEETQRLTMITRKLLILSKVDAGQLKLQRESVDLVKMLNEAIEDCEMQSESIEFQRKLPTSYFAEVDKTFFRQILQNLLGNAVKYNRETNAVVSATLFDDGYHVFIDIFNTGEPIDLEFQGKLFERFVRGDAARNRSIDGIGLGLNLSQEFAKAHDVELCLLKSNEEGTIFRLSWKV